MTNTSADRPTLLAHQLPKPSTKLADLFSGVYSYDYQPNPRTPPRVVNALASLLNRTILDDEDNLSTLSDAKNKRRSWAWETPEHEPQYYSSDSSLSTSPLDTPESQQHYSYCESESDSDSDQLEPKVLCSKQMKNQDQTWLFRKLESETLEQEKVQLYLESIFEYTKYDQLEPIIYVYACVYIDRFVMKNPKFRITAKNVSRLLIVAITVAAVYEKGGNSDDRFFAVAGNLTPKKLNKLKLHFLFSIEFQLYVSEAEFEVYRCCLENERTIRLNGDS